MFYSDVDGTLIPHSNRISSTIIEQIKAFVDAGYADIGIAMQNAVEPVKDVSDYMAGHVDDEAITNVLCTIMLQHAGNSPAVR